ncbi:MAG: DUF4124 domain-containing protein [Nitrospira sp.]|nr:DUF4124 domain-containing protein [Nitrospira sp.]
MKFFTLSVIAGFFLWPMIGSAELYKWTDEQGNLHITDAPPFEPHKKSGPTVKPAPRSSSPIKAAAKPTMSELFQAEVRPVPDPSMTPSSSKDAAAQPNLEGLSPTTRRLRVHGKRSMIPNWWPKVLCSAGKMNVGSNISSMCCRPQRMQPT